MHSCVENRLRKWARRHTIAMHDNYAIANVGNDLSNILKIELVLLLAVPVFPLPIRDNDVSREMQSERIY